MSTPNLNFKTILSNFKSEIWEPISDVSSIREMKAQREVREIIYSLSDQYRDYKSWDQREIQRVTEESLEKVDLAVSKIKASNPDEKALLLAKKINHLKGEINNFKEAFLHKEEIDQNSLGPFLDEKWAQEEYLSLLENNNEWALSKLEQLVQEGKEFALKVLVEKAPINFDFRKILIENKENPSLQKFFVDYLEHSDSAHQKRIGQSLLSLLESGMDEEWQTKIVDLFSKDFSEKTTWLIYNFLNSRSRRGESSPMALKLIELSKSNSKVRMMTASLAALLSFGSYLFKEFRIQLKNFPELEGSYCTINNRTYARLCDFEKSVEQYASRPGLGGKFIWKKHDPVFATRLLYLQLKRDLDLIGIITEKTPFEARQDQAISKCFPKAGSLMMGRGVEKGKIEQEVAEILKAHDVPVFYPQSITKDPIKPCENLYPIESMQKSVPWLQDYCNVHEKKITIPRKQFSTRSSSYILHLRRARMEALYESEEKKMRHFDPMGSVSSHHGDLRLLSFLLQKMNLDDLDIDFTSNEGGNCLIGSYEGVPYALVGRDALELTRKHLGEDLARLGYKKDHNGKWVQGDRYTGEMKLTDEEVRLFFAVDLGFENVEQVFFVEQPDFHIDMSMSIVGDKTILINDSMLAYHKLEEYVSKNSSRPGLEKNRLKSSKKVAEGRKLYEDAAAKDLEELGFNIVRVGGRFENILHNHPENHQINFFNFVSLTTPSGEKLILSLGCDEFFKAEFEKMVQEHIGEDVTIHYVNQSESEVLLSGSGGIHCVTKVLPFKLK